MLEINKLKLITEITRFPRGLPSYQRLTINESQRFVTTVLMDGHTYKLFKPDTAPLHFVDKHFLTVQNNSCCFQHIFSPV